MQLPIIDQADNQESITIPDQIVNQSINERFIAQVIRGLQANRRQDTVQTKTRGEVSGGGRKPWRQKGTGRARQGSIRAPQWVGGGIVFGPRKNRHHTLKVNQSARKKAKLLLLIDKIKHQAVTVIKFLPDFNPPKTQSARSWLEALPIAGGRILIIGQKIQTNFGLSIRNIPGIDYTTVGELNAYDLIRCDWIVIENSALQQLMSIEQK